MVLLTRSWEAGGDSKYLTFQSSLKGEVLFFSTNKTPYLQPALHICLFVQERRCCVPAQRCMTLGTASEGCGWW